MDGSSGAKRLVPYLNALVRGQELRMLGHNSVLAASVESFQHRENLASAHD